MVKWGLKIFEAVVKIQCEDRKFLVEHQYIDVDLKVILKNIYEDREHISRL